MSNLIASDTNVIDTAAIGVSTTAEPITICQTTCPYCGVGCGVDIQQHSTEVTVDVNGSEAEQAPLALAPVKGRVDHPANLGRLCVKGSALHETLGDHGRVSQALIDGEAVELDRALNKVADGFRQIIDQHGPDSVAFYVSGQLLTEDYYVANKLMKGFIGSGNIDTNSRLCMSSAVAGYKRAFGSDAVPCSYEDIEQADLVVLVGSNAAWTHPVIYQRLLQAQKLRPEMKIVVIDPRKTATSEQADLYLPIKPGSDAFLFNGLLAYLAQENALDDHFILNYTNHFDQAIEQAKSGLKDVVRDTAKLCAVSETDLLQFFQLFREHQHSITLYSQGVNQSSSGVDKCNAIINCHLATGRIGQPGMGPFSLTGQPNAMGGREVGGLANQLAAHMDFTPEAIDRVGRFWQSDNMATEPGLKAVDLFHAVEKGDIKAIWVMATNPVVSMPDSDQVIRALEKCELVIVSDCYQDSETSRYADVVLPAAGWGEKDGTVTNSERRISRQKAFLPLTGDIKPDWWLMSQVAQRMGYTEAFSYQDPSEIFREHALLSGFENYSGSSSARDFDISLLAKLDQNQYDQLQPIQWPVNNRAPLGTARLFTDKQFYTANGRANFLAITPKAPEYPTDEAYPFVMNTGRIRDQWHTMNRTARSQRLLEHSAEPYVDMNPDDAYGLHLKDQQLVALKGPQGKFIGRLKLTQNQTKGSLFVPIHWNRCFSGQANVDSLVNPVVDPISGQPELKHSTVKVYDPALNYCGFVLTEQNLKIENMPYWARIPLAKGERYELADQTPLNQHPLFYQLQKVDGEWLYYQDPAQGIFRAVCLQENRLVAVLASAQDLQHLPPRQWLSDSLGCEIADQDRLSLLAGEQANQPDTGRTVCACFQIGEKSIQNAIQAQGLDSVEALGDNLGCGTNCGSCIPELKSILQESLAVEA